MPSKPLETFYSRGSQAKYIYIYRWQDYVILKLTELGTLEWWISGLMLNPLFLLSSRLTKSRDYVSLKINYLGQQI